MAIHTFLKGIYQKVNEIARLEFKLAYYNSVSQCINHYTTGTGESNEDAFDANSTLENKKKKIISWKWVRKKEC